MSRGHFLVEVRRLFTQFVQTVCPQLKMILWNMSGVVVFTVADWTDEEFVNHFIRKLFFSLYIKKRELRVKEGPRSILIENVFKKI